MIILLQTFKVSKTFETNLNNFSKCIHIKEFIIIPDKNQNFKKRLLENCKKKT